MIKFITTLSDFNPNGIIFYTNNTMWFLQLMNPQAHHVYSSNVKELIVEAFDGVELTTTSSNDCSMAALS